ncbi:nuclear transport factor 2 family protein [Bosea sp. (in: a-proteobacteria)]|uniref:nuclear transport factor 2 family protein n=1 Tax=Bosea sp. (in: a-proteobacteria) TaxID=1871050 RepID=UPI002FCAC2F9
MLKRLLIGCLLACAMPAAASAHPPTLLSPSAEKATAEEVVAFRKELAAAIAAKDAARLREMYAPSFVHTQGAGKLDGKDARLVSALAGDPVIENAPVEDLVVRVPSDWVAVATGVSSIRSLADGMTYSFRWTAVYVRTPTSWNLAASQATRLGEVKP